MERNVMRLCELREKEVINICNCECLGFVIDVEIDICTGMVLALIIIIPWKHVVKIGPDIILVELPEPRGK